MTRRQAAGLLLAAALVCGGRLVRHALLVDGAGAWRDPLWLDSLLPPLPDAAPAAGPAAAGLSPRAAALAPAEPIPAGLGPAGAEPGGAAGAGPGGGPAAVAAIAAVAGADPGDDAASAAASGSGPPAPPPGAALAAAPGGTGRLDVNTASAESLATLPGIGSVLAARIVADRAAHGPFASPADLQRVRGIGPRLASRLAPRLRFASPSRTAAPPGVPGGP